MAKPITPAAKIPLGRVVASLNEDPARGAARLREAKVVVQGILILLGTSQLPAKSVLSVLAAVPDRAPWSPDDLVRRVLLLFAWIRASRRKGRTRLRQTLETMRERYQQRLERTRVTARARMLVDLASGWEYIENVRRCRRRSCGRASCRARQCRPHWFLCESGNERRVYCGRGCATYEKALRATREQRQDARDEELRRVAAAVRAYRGLKRKPPNAKAWVAGRADLTPKWITRHRNDRKLSAEVRAHLRAIGFSAL